MTFKKDILSILSGIDKRLDRLERDLEYYKTIKYNFPSPYYVSGYDEVDIKVIILALLGYLDLDIEKITREEKIQLVPKKPVV